MTARPLLNLLAITCAASGCYAQLSIQTSFPIGSTAPGLGHDRTTDHVWSFAGGVLS